MRPIKPLYPAPSGDPDDTEPDNPEPEPPVEIPPDDPNKPADRPDPAPVEEPSPPKPGRWTRSGRNLVSHYQTGGEPARPTPQLTA